MMRYDESKCRNERKEIRKVKVNDSQGCESTIPKPRIQIMNLMDYYTCFIDMIKSRLIELCAN